MKEAWFYTSKDKNKIQCFLCPHNCIIFPDKVGICKIRKNINGVLYSLVYGKPIAQSIDPIEKKPLFHFYPGSQTLSIATVGCNFSCKHCQNADISQPYHEYYPPSDQVSAASVVSFAKKMKVTSIAYTYTEPTIFYEYAFDIAKIAHEHGLKNVLITNGYIAKKPLEKIAPYIDGVNIDLKAMNEEFYQKICGGHLQPVLDTIIRYLDFKIWVEITTLLIPGYNDDEKELFNLASYIYENNPFIPWHITGFTPTYKLTNAPPTSSTTLENAANIGKEVGLKHIYLGNRGFGENTICPKCGKTIIERMGFSIVNNKVKHNYCPFCHSYIYGIGLC